MTKTIAERIDAHSPDAIEAAVKILAEGGLVALPTETVYGLGANALNQKAVSKIFSVKERPSYNPLICHVNGPNMAKRYVYVSETANRLMEKFWPGPLTLVLPKKPAKKPGAQIPDSVTAGLDTLAVRCPDMNVTREIISKLDRPVAAPSANPSGKLSPTSADDVLEALGGKIPLVIDAGRTNIGLESTILGVFDDQITLLRPGSITADDLRNAGFDIGVKKPETDQFPDSNLGKINAPGQLESHYAPEAKLRLNADKAEPSEVFIGFGSLNGDFNLSPKACLTEAAQNLFHMLRRADKASIGRVAVASIPETGIGHAINDRLRRAAAPRPNQCEKH